MMWFTSCIHNWQKIEDKDMLYSIRLVKSTLLNLGELEEQWQESQEFQDLVLTDLVRPLLVTCAEKLECLLH